MNFAFRIDYEATVKAANDAQTSAQIAQNNAAEAAAHASITSLHDIHSSIPQSTHHDDAAPPTSHQSLEFAASSNKDQQAKASSKSSETIASNHNYGNSNNPNTNFKPSKPFKFAGF